MKKFVLIIAVTLVLTTPSLSFASINSPSSFRESSLRDNLPYDPSPLVYRFWSETYRGHFYTSSSVEAADVDANYPDNVWRPEGTVFEVYHPQLCIDAGPPPPGICVSVYRFWSPIYRHHFYTISAAEKNFVQSTMPEWQYEGVAYAANTDPLFGLPLYRFWSNTYRSHFYTTSVAERDLVISTMPEWQYEGIAFYTLDSIPS